MRTVCTSKDQTVALNFMYSEYTQMQQAVTACSDTDRCNKQELSGLMPMTQTDEKKVVFFFSKMLRMESDMPPYALIRLD